MLENDNLVGDIDFLISFIDYLIGFIVFIGLIDCISYVIDCVDGLIGRFCFLYKFAMLWKVILFTRNHYYDES